MWKTRQSNRAFTLIEFVVVAVMGVVLLLILAPSVGRLKEQARVQVCVSNLRTIGQASNQYLFEYEDMPWTVRSGSVPHDSGTYNWALYTEFIWGGGMPDKTEDEWYETGITGGWPPTDGDICKLPPLNRPLNRFIDATVAWNDPRRHRHGSSFWRTRFPMVLPDLFKCPSDSSPLVPGYGGSEPDVIGETPFSTWEFWGTSYPINWYWPYYYQQVPLGYQLPYNSNFLSIIGATRNVPGLGKHLLKDKGGRWASRFVIFYENRANYALLPAYPRGMISDLEPKNLRGWHKRMNYHTVAFRDGSARYMQMDTRYVNGPGWTIWPNHPWEGVWEPYDELNP